MNKSVFIAAAFLLAAVLWLASGLIWHEEQAATDGTAPDDAPALAQVRVMDMRAQEMTNSLSVQGRTRAERSVILRAEMTGQVAEIQGRKGSRVEAGAAVVRLDAEDRRARLAEARALVEQRRIEFQAAERLAARDFASRTRLAEARARLDEAEARLATAQTELQRTQIRAPFAGVLDDTLVEVGDYVSPGSDVARLLDLSTIVVLGEVSERQAGSLAIGATTEIRLLDGRVIQGRLRWIGSAAREATRTFPVEVEAPNPDGSIPHGITAELRLPLRTVPAHRVSPAVLTLDERGAVGVKTVNEEDVVEFHEVTIISDGPDGIWLGGLPEAVRMIVLGQDWVRAGDKVIPVLAPVVGAEVRP
ncbi:efflux RND transporter periplasmic adaptor subunit [Telmatospirillum sp. J64-1]|uniref:efflux RND transporter periplasmic adaptor subunit n=1 Tax=Telmatospirillum sp. J64-1 TaxID=2502183 RepID=UPI00115E0509|nr:efflux RND transporter periplasmic adaptor subunit [Telmatospirillum sp. J64-1]